MEGIDRKPFQGVENIIRFNWHFYVTAIASVVLLSVSTFFLSNEASVVINSLIALTIIATVLSLLISCYIYDYSNLYKLEWLNFLPIGPEAEIINVNAGFDETSFLIAKKYPSASLKVFDFYDPVRHTEVSIERARKVHAVYPHTKNISTSAVPLEKNSVDYIFNILSVHEIRNQRERIEFFKQLRNGLKQDGKIVVAEHLRDLQNFIAYNLGFFHFYSHSEWKANFSSAGLAIEKEIKVTPFISVFILRKDHGAAS